MGQVALCGLRKHRKLWGLRQHELAALLGISADQVSRLERSQRVPSTEVAFACKLLFNLSSKEIFTKLHEPVEEALMRRVYAMHERLTKEPGLRSARKRELLEDCLKRAITHDNNHEL